MALEIVDPELLGVTESTLTVSFAVRDGSGPVDAPAEVLVDGEVRGRSEETAGTRLVRIEGVAPSRGYRIEIRARDAWSSPGPYFPESVETLPAPRTPLAASFATLNDLHFGEPRFGGTMLEDGSYGDPAPGYPAVYETEGDVPYWQYMNEDAVSDINALGVACVVIKGDVADRGRPEQFAAAKRTFAGFDAPHHAFLGNHDYYGLSDGIEVDGYALLDQPRAPRTLELAGWRLVLLDTVEPGEHHGVFPQDRISWLSKALEETRELAIPTLLLTHHQPVPVEFADRFPNTIGVLPEHSLALFELLGRHRQVKGVLIGHTHRNRVRRYRPSGRLPFVEVHCVKDYPGGFAHYRLFEDGEFRQEVMRTSSERALAHSARCRDFFAGRYRDFALGRLGERCFAVGP